MPIRGNAMANSAPGEWFLTNSWVNDWRVLALERDGRDVVVLSWEDGVYRAEEPDCC